MSRFDVLTRQWKFQCLNTGDIQGIQLAQFRHLREFSIQGHLPVFRLYWQCPACDDMHIVLADSRELDLEPLESIGPIAYDFRSARYDWDPAVYGRRLQENMLKGRWPLVLNCYRCGSVPMWPTRLQNISLSDQQALLEYSCPHCERSQIIDYPAQSLQYPRHELV